MLTALLFTANLWAQSSWKCAAPTFVRELPSANQDVKYQPDRGDESQKMDIHIPGPPAKPPYKTIMMIHGGCFTKGGKWDYDSKMQIERMVKMGYAVASVDYRLADPELHINHYPAGLDDVRDAFCYLKKNGSTFGLETDRIPVAGYSAGGTLAAYLATGHRAGSGHKTDCNPEPMPTAGLILHPRTDFLQSTEKRKPNGELDCGEKFVGMRRNEKNPQQEFKNADILSHIDRNKTVPIYIVHGDADKDVNIKNSERLCIGLPGKCKLITIKGAEHMFRGRDEMDQVYSGVCTALNEVGAKQTASTKSAAPRAPGGASR